MLLTIIATALIVGIWFITKSIWITVAGGLAVLMILHTLTPIFQQWWNRLFPPLPLYLLRERRMDDPVPGRGARVLIVTPHLALTQAAARTALFERLLDDAVQDVSEKKPVFAFRWSQVEEQNLPLRIQTACCGDKDSGMRKCYHQWLHDINSKDFGSWKEGRELFLYDGQFSDPDTGELQASAVLVLFDARLETEATL